MPDLSQIFNPEDPGFLRTVAEVWRVEELDINFEKLFSNLKSNIENKEIMAELLDELPKPAEQALKILAGKGGKMPWADFSHKYGSIREMGAGRRDRQRPDQNPESISEILYYKGLLGRVFLDEKPEPREFAFVPDEILVGIQKSDLGGLNLPGKPIQPNSINHFLLANDSILQDACTWITALRLGPTQEEILSLPLKVQEKSIRVLLKRYGILDDQENVRSGPVKEFLKMPRSKAIGKLANIWRHSSEFNDLYMVEGLVFEANCAFDPLSVKEQVLEVLNHIPLNTWWETKSLIEYFHSHQPNFLRSSGDFDSWFVRDADSGQYLQGFDSWDKIEGRLLEFLVFGILHWLGFLDLGYTSTKSRPTAFRLSRWWKALSVDQTPSFPDPKPGDIFVTSRGKVSVPVSSSLAVRYQIARFAILTGSNPQAYSYQITHGSLKKAKEQGLKTGQLVNLVKNHSSSPLSPSFLKALQNWETSGPQVHFDNLKIIRFSVPTIVNILLKSKAASFIRESLNPNTIAYDPAGEKIIKSVLLDAGYFSEDEKEKEV